MPDNRKVDLNISDHQPASMQMNINVSSDKKFSNFQFTLWLTDLQ